MAGALAWRALQAGSRRIGLISKPRSGAPDEKHDVLHWLTWAPGLHVATSCQKIRGSYTHTGESGLHRTSAADAGAFRTVLSNEETHEGIVQNQENHP
jgi:hypothetical protein